MILTVGKTFIFCCLKVMILLLFPFYNNSEKILKIMFLVKYFMEEKMPQNSLQTSFCKNQSMPDTWPPRIESSNER